MKRLRSITRSTAAKTADANYVWHPLAQPPGPVGQITGTNVRWARRTREIDIWAATSSRVTVRSYRGHISPHRNRQRLNRNRMVSPPTRPRRWLNCRSTWSRCRSPIRLRTAKSAVALRGLLAPFRNGCRAAPNAPHLSHAPRRGAYTQAVSI